MKTQVIKVSAGWCGPCRMYKPIFEEVSKMPDFKDLEFVSLSCDDEKNEKLIEDELKVKSLPTTIIRDENKKVLGTKVGAMTKATLVKFINNSLSGEE